MVRMPMQERTRLGQDGEFALRQRSCRGEAAQIHEVILGLSRAGKPAGPFGIDAEENAFPCLGRFEGLQLSRP